jgi:lysyl-tRNA synthetase class 2
MSDQTRDVFKKRSQIVSIIRGFLDNRNILEVETPMMQPIPGEQ